MGTILVAVAAVLLFVNSLLGAASVGLFGITGTSMLVLPSFCVVHMLLTFHRIRQASR
jgi:hypothetical protein